ncbi:MAG: UvrD-helicase domain-containing protein, partial [Gammaproteobacteria bacterium]|nr:UvrD-helicase domain-containing protein [Gammaproteobacteria bacterium]
MNEFQLKAVNFDTNCVITACLGSGKTTVLVNKAKRILSNSNHYLIGVTFSKNSADELGERLVQLCGPSVVTQFKTGTFHSLAKRQLESYYGGKKLRILANHE